MTNTPQNDASTPLGQLTVDYLREVDRVFRETAVDASPEAVAAREAAEEVAGASLGLLMAVQRWRAQRGEV